MGLPVSSVERILVERFVASCGLERCAWSKECRDQREAEYEGREHDREHVCAGCYGTGTVMHWATRQHVECAGCAGTGITATKHSAAAWLDVRPSFKSQARRKR